MAGKQVALLTALGQAAEWATKGGTPTDLWNSAAVGVPEQAVSEAYKVK